ncbi:MAG: prepilin-type N-terminal cleavage/methylation domain-containing protein [Kiritimatiellae bacterium]|nr:prepilin-type N-terminal cleavage/methylation domain-containing protein [Kiritimatiellia bacterium]
MKNSRRAAFTLIELLVVIAVIGLLAAILVPAITVGLDRAHRASCLNNVKELTQAFVSYGADHKGHLPDPDDFSSLDKVAKMMFTNEYVTVPTLWLCPADKRRKAVRPDAFVSSFSSDKNCSYIYFAGYNTLKAADELSTLPLIADKLVGGTLSAQDLHGANYRNVGFLGGNVRGLKDAAEANKITSLPQLKDYDIEILK